MNYPEHILIPAKNFELIHCKHNLFAYTREHLTPPWPHKIELENQGTLKAFRKVSNHLGKVVHQDFSERAVRRAFAELLHGKISWQKLMIKSSD